MAIRKETKHIKTIKQKGELAKNFKDGGINMQKKRLQNDGIEVIKHKVDLGKYQWKKK